MNKQKDISTLQYNDTTSGGTSSSYVSALDWKCLLYQKKTIILKNTGSNSLKYKVLTYAYIDGSDYEEVAETTLVAGDTAEIILSYTYAQVVIQVKDAGTHTTYRIDYSGLR